MTDPPDDRPTRRVGALVAWALLVVLAIASAIVDVAGIPVDLPLFSGAGRAVLRGDLGVYRDSGLQAGPLMLVFTGAGDLLAERLRIAPAWVFAPAISLGSALGIALVARAAVPPGRRPTLLAVGAGALSVLWGLGSHAYLSGHPANVVIPLLWVVAALLARRGATAAAGLLIAVTAALEPWGILGAVVLLLATDVSKVIAGGGVAAAVVAAAYAPFVLSGSFAMHEYAWPAQAASVVPWLTPGQDVAWWWRVAQGAVATVCGAAAALVWRGRHHLIWGVPLIVVAVRLVTDPTNYGYYWIAPQVLILIAVVAVAGPVEDWRAEPSRAVRAATLVMLVAAPLRPVLPDALVCVLLAGAAMVAVSFDHRSELEPPPARPSRPTS